MDFTMFFTLAGVISVSAFITHSLVRLDNGNH